MSPHPLRHFLPLSLGSLVLLGACADVNPAGPASTPSLGRAKTTAAATVSVVMTGLNAPKQLAFGPEGALYVAETGTGAEGESCIPAGDAEAPSCYSLTGSITRYWKGVQERIVTGLPSLGGGGGVTAGPNDIAFQAVDVRDGFGVEAGRSPIASVVAGMGRESGPRAPGCP